MLTRRQQVTRKAKRAARRARIGGEKLVWGLERIGLSPVSLLDFGSRMKGDKMRHMVAGAAYGPDPRQRLDIWAPKEDHEGPLPVVLFFYGGGWVTGDRTEYAFVGRALAAAGFLAVLADYRLAPQHQFPAFVEDGALAMKWLRSHVTGFGGDPDRIAVAGHSAGGHLAGLLALDRRYLRDVGLSEQVIRAAVLLSAPTNFLPFKDPRPIAAMGEWPRPEETQPITYARGDGPPMLLLHGRSDITVRARNSQQLARAISEAGGAAELKIYQGASHSDLVKSFSPLFRKDTPVLEDVVDFLRRRLV
ncbi:alpha/beta hydrolase [Sphingomicrobium flavum]|uniref:alpha/beta hydrolase n=1 Tax=Sphingomicrobium flavum TaxID=1229164 RepID=UPI0021AD6D4B|nr:alpha/beta hydrolase [Sphingomicrobium flavum]